MKTEFPNYKLSKEEKAVVEHFEGQSGFDLIWSEEVKDQESFLACIERNHKWLLDHAQEVVHCNEKKLRKLKYYTDIVYR